MQTSLRFLATALEFVHGALMVLWGLGLPLLLWHRFERLSRLYMWLSLVFVAGSLISHQLLGECVLTTLARELWQGAGMATDNVPFIVRFTNSVARIRPSTRSAVLIWEAAILIYCAAFLWGRKALAERPPHHHSRGISAAEGAQAGSSRRC
jgi:hypothetical protein